MSEKNTYKIVFQRSFLVEGLPEDMTPAESHLQIFDNYLEKTRLRLRKMRQPETKNWTRVFEQIYPFENNKFSKLKIAQMFLNETEYKVLEHFKGREIRKNRYFFNENGVELEIDIFLGNLWGLNIAKVYFQNEKEQSSFELPPMAILEITNEEFFLGNSLVDKTFNDVQLKLSEREK
jgi:CYTH domain-containing protein